MLQDDLWADPKKDSNITEQKIDILQQINALYEKTADSPVDKNQVVPIEKQFASNNESFFQSDFSFSKENIFQKDLWSIKEEKSDLLEHEENYVPSDGNDNSAFLLPINISEDDSFSSSSSVNPTDDTTNYPSLNVLQDEIVEELLPQRIPNTISIASSLDQKYLNSDSDMPEDDLMEGLALLDLQLELLEQERDEELFEANEAASIEETRGRARGFKGSQSLLYIDWSDSEQAEIKALELLGYSKLKISDTTRAFILQVARSCNLTNKKEKLYLEELLQARAAYSSLPSEPEEHIEERTRLEQVIDRIEKELIQNVSWVAVKKAVQFLGMGVDLDDLIQSGMIGVITAVRRYNPKRNSRLIIVVGWWVFSKLSREISERSRLIQFPTYIHHDLLHIQKIQNDYENKTGENMSALAMANACGMSLDRLQQLEALLKWKFFSIQRLARKEVYHDGYSFEYIDRTLISTEEDAVLEHVWQDVSTNLLVEPLLAILTPKERAILEMRLALYERGGEPLTLENVGQQFNVTRERIRQIESKALDKIRKRLAEKRVQAQQQLDQEEKEKIRKRELERKIQEEEQLKLKERKKIEVRLVPSRSQGILQREEGEGKWVRARLDPNQLQTKIEAINKKRAQRDQNLVQRQKQSESEEGEKTKTRLDSDQLQRKIEAINKRREKFTQNQIQKE